MREQAELHVITDLGQIKALADPLRQRILGALVAEPRTTKQVATLLGQPPTKLYHHVDLLEKAGLIDLIETRPKRGTTEKYFQAIAHRFTVGSGSLGGEAYSALGEAVSRAFSDAQEGVRNSFEDLASSPEEEIRTIVAMGSLRIARRDLPKLQERLASLVSEFDGCGKAEERESYRYLATIYPVPENEPEE